MGMSVKFGPADYEARLQGGVVLWKGIPHRVSVDGHEIHITDLVTNRTVARSVEPLDNNLDISSPMLGFINGEVHTYYLQRIPRRRYRQALESNSILEFTLRAEGLVNENGGGRSDILYTDFFRNAFTKRYPTFDEAVVDLNNEVRTGVALSREIAITKDDLDIVKVWYKTGEQPVGWIEPGGRTVRVPNNDKGWLISMYLNEVDWEVQ